ncbi:MAG: helix-turn-helix domain-containing protein [Gammaproteobacteria bacterium]|jgi:predicted transcriptional regulator|nr:helix-turn-helix domain-containing protein [Gammaproteobacteria bacterium]MBT4606529.1 helix-turn-helix domain-containing protein [Thiotrichales bacterium]MBT5465326.1 helix-turn-helix domain-containing protein [Candidatus Neomarinimicrobiota bacterium]MBT4329734.1 helix-turn-helix domain-containing protein [Gammaproteobacteria bacterium]MBT5370184.1 helix-turn-helix domain-containing protein [Gammaproteobacteria bacterium]
MKIFNIRVGEPLGAALERAELVMTDIEEGKEPQQYFGASFQTMAQLSKVFSPTRWALLEFLKDHGPMSIYKLAKDTDRNYSNVHGDVKTLVEWGVIEKDEDNNIMVPWDKIVVDWPILKDAA